MLLFKNKNLKSVRVKIGLKILLKLDFIKLHEELLIKGSLT